MTGASEWQDRVGHSWAQEWQRTDRSFRELTGRLVKAAQARAYGCALDIGCGAGELTLRLAEAAPAATHVGLDISEELVAVARQRTAGLANARIELGDASAWSGSDGAKPDLLTSRHGVMFFAEPVQAFAHLRHRAGPDAGLVFSCFRKPAENDWIKQLASALPSQPPSPDPHAPGPFAFGEADYVQNILREAAWRDIECTPVDYPMIVGEGEEPVADAISYFRVIGPAARAMAEMDAPQRSTVLDDLARMLEGHRQGRTVSLGAACWIVTARKSG